MTTVHKVVLRTYETQDIKIPSGAEILCVKMQGAQVCLWYRFDPTEHTDIRRITFCGTGHPAPNAREGKYLGTVMMYNDALVLHAFERISTV